MRDEDQTTAVVGHAPQDHEQVVDLSRGQDCGRFIKNQQLSVPVEGLDYLNPLALTDSEPAYLN